MNPPDPLFRELEPPPGGLAQLRARIEADERQHARWRWALVAVAILAIIGAAIAIPLALRQPALPEAAQQAAAPLPSPAHPAGEHLGLSTPQAEPAVVIPQPGRSAALKQIEVSHPDVVLYLHASKSTPREAP